MSARNVYVCALIFNCVFGFGFGLNFNPHPHI
jgi:hypothetical protein